MAPWQLTLTICPFDGSAASAVPTMPVLTPGVHEFNPGRYGRLGDPPRMNLLGQRSSCGLVVSDVVSPLAGEGHLLYSRKPAMASDGCPDRSPPYEVLFDSKCQQRTFVHC